MREDLSWERVKAGVKKLRRESGDEEWIPFRSVVGVGKKERVEKGVIGREMGEWHREKRKDLRGLRRGRVKCERVLDLHGLRVEEGRVALDEFMERSYRDGCRWVHVITGKGTGRMRDSFWDWVRMRGGGVVLSVNETAAKHGGSGAFYVGLKRYRGDG